MRIVTRGDIDGVTSSILVSEMEDVKDIALIHPQDITDKRFSITSKDILINVPYDPACAMWFDHHAHTIMPRSDGFKGSHALKDSAARVVYEHYDSPELNKYEHIVDETDRFDSGRLTKEDVLDPKGMAMLGFLMDPRTGVWSGYKDFFKDIVRRLRKRSVEELLMEADLSIRASRYKRNEKTFQDVLRSHSEVHANVVKTDFRTLVKQPVGNRFIIFTIYPDANVSVRIQPGPANRFVAVTIGHNIFNRTCKTDVGRLCREYGGGGLTGAGACIFDPSIADRETDKIIRRLKE